MAFANVTFRPGVNTNATPAANEGGWSSSNLVRWWGPSVQKLNGWKHLANSTMAGLCRAMHAYEDLDGVHTFLLGTDGGPQIYYNAGVGSVESVALTRRTINLAQGAFASTATSTTVTVTDVGHGAATGDTVVFNLTFGVGGRKISQGFSTTITVTNSSTWHFTMPLAALTNGGGQAINFFNYGGPASSPPAGVGPNDIAVLLPGHNFSVGDTFNVEQLTTSTTFSPGFSLFGPYSVAGVIDANNFWFTYGPTGTPDGTVVNVPINGGKENISYSGTTPTTPQNWFVDNFGNFGLFCFAGGPIYYYTPPASSSPTAQAIQSGPQINQGMFVAMPQAQIIAFGSEATLGGGVQDPLLLRWCDAGDFTVWVADATNQAGSFRLSRGSYIVGGLQAPQNTLIWTDTDLWSMQYIGQPLIYSFTILGSGCGLIAPQARTVLGNATYWMSIQGFFRLGGAGVEPIDCPIWDVIFGDFPSVGNLSVYAGAVNKTWMWSDTPFNEVWTFYASVSGGTGEIDSYVKMTVTPQGMLWDYGKLERTAGIDQSIAGTPIAADGTLQLQQHDIGYDADGVPMVGAFIKSGLVSLGDGESFSFMDQLWPDLKWLGSNGYVTITLWSCSSPSGNLTTMHGPFTVVPETLQISVRVRDRYIAYRIDWGVTLGCSARHGATKARMAPAGRV